MKDISVRGRQRYMKSKMRGAMCTRIKFCLLSVEVDYLFFIERPEDEEEEMVAWRRE